MYQSEIRDELDRLASGEGKGASMMRKLGRIGKANKKEKKAKELKKANTKKRVRKAPKMDGPDASFIDTSLSHVEPADLTRHSTLSALTMAGPNASLIPMVNVSAPPMRMKKPPKSSALFPLVINPPRDSRVDAKIKKLRKPKEVSKVYKPKNGWMGPAQFKHMAENATTAQAKNHIRDEMKKHKVNPEFWDPNDKTAAERFRKASFQRVFDKYVASYSKK